MRIANLIIAYSSPHFSLFFSTNHGLVNQKLLLFGGMGRDEWLVSSVGQCGDNNTKVAGLIRTRDTVSYALLRKKNNTPFFGYFSFVGSSSMDLGGIKYFHIFMHICLFPKIIPNIYISFLGKYSSTC